jgi:hypothetical protein
VIDHDLLLAAVGVVPKSVTDMDRARAARLPALFQERAAAWWGLEKAKPYKNIDATDAEKVYDRIALDPDPSELRTWLTAAGDDPGPVEALYDSVKLARDYLRINWPRRVTLDTFGGEVSLPLAVDDQAEALSLFAVVNDPTRVLDEMDSYTLSPSQGDAFRKVYPDLAKLHGAALRAGAAKQHAGDPQWMPSEAQESELAILTGVIVGPVDTSAPQPAAPPPDQQKDLGAKSARTQADASSRPKAADSARR